MASAPWVLTRSGRKIYLDGRSNDHSIEDIAFSLAHKPRYNGHTHHYYSVAQHSVFVAQAMTGADTPDYWHKYLAALLHDAAEYVVSDVPGPVKKLCPDLQKLEYNVQYDILKGIESKVRPDLALGDRLHLISAWHYHANEIHETDTRLCATEMMELFGHTLEGVKPLNLRPDIHIIPCWSPEAAFSSFLTCYRVALCGANLALPR